MDQFLEGLKGFGGITAEGHEAEAASGTGCEHHQAHDTFAIDAFAVFFDHDFALEAAGDADEHGGGPGMDAQSVGHDEVAGQLGARII